MSLSGVIDISLVTSEKQANRILKYLSCSSGVVSQVGIFECPGTKNVLDFGFGLVLRVFLLGSDFRHWN